MAFHSAQTQASVIERPILWTPPRRVTDPAALDEKCRQLRERLRDIARAHQHTRLASSLSAEDMVITDVILRAAEQGDPYQDIAAHIDIFTLETGRLPAETLALLDQIQTQYGVRLAIYTPDESAVQAYIGQYGLNGFYESLQARRQCCDIRKVVPLAAALAGADAWITGQRREQSVTRSDLHLHEHDEARGISKYNPLFDWSEQEIWAYVERYSVPVNALHYQGYPSIGCDPCTKAIRVGEDPRAGRWWWENQDSRECGLHVHN